MKKTLEPWIRVFYSQKVTLEYSETLLIHRLYD